jgi:hypothetical protein
VLWQAALKAELVEAEKAAMRRAATVDSHKRKREMV